MIKVALHGAEFFAYHGFYPEEQKLGNRFIVNIETSFKYNGAFNDELGGTVNYEQLYDIACSQMQQTKKLIETVACSIMEDIQQQFPALQTIEVNIKKLHPPLGSRIDHSSVTVNYSKA